MPLDVGYWLMEESHREAYNSKPSFGFLTYHLMESFLQGDG